MKTNSPFSRKVTYILWAFYLFSSVPARSEDFKDEAQRIMNATGPRAWVADPVADILRNWWGDDVDLSFFEQAGHAYDSVYDVRRIRQELGFVAQRLP